MIKKLSVVGCAPRTIPSPNTDKWCASAPEGTNLRRKGWQSVQSAFCLPPPLAQGGPQAGGIPLAPSVGGQSQIGLTLVEVLITIAIAGLFSTALYGFYGLHTRVLKAEETRISMQESSRLAIDFLVRELRLAGARPVRSGPCDGFERLTIAHEYGVTIQYDFRGNGPNTPPDGCPDDPNERIAYTYENASQVLKRATGSGAPQPFINDVPSGGFFLRYFDRGGSELTPPLDEPGRAAVHSMRVTVRTSKPSPDPQATAPIASELSSTVFLPSPPE